MKAVFGPINSWRLGRALCVDMVMSDRKYCSFDCVYCPQRRATRGMTKRRWFVASSWAEAQLSSFNHNEADWVAFTGRGEPTLAGNLSETIDCTRSTLGLPVAVLTNSALMPRDEVKNELAKADMVIAKLDAPDEELFRAINRPFVSYSLTEIVSALKEFRQGFSGKLALQVTLLDANRPVFGKIANLAKQIGPDEVQLNTVGPRYGGAQAPQELAEICQLFSGIQVTGLALQPTPPPPVTANRDLPWLTRANTEVMLMGAAT